MATHIKIGKEAQRMLGEIKKRLPDLSDREIVELALGNLLREYENCSPRQDSVPATKATEKIDK
jgi:hypothetical protein